MISSAGAAWCAAAGVCKRAAAGVQCGWRKRSVWRARGWASGWSGPWRAAAGHVGTLRAFLRL